ncbi:MAG: hypothetical protein RL591_469 [Planctomycetota bacterium]|jgi:hypothetical protein
MNCAQILLGCTFVSGAIAPNAIAALVNVDFVQNSSTAAYTGAGVLGSAGQTWNSSIAGQGWQGNAMMALSGLKDSTGATIAGTSFTVGAANGTVGDHNAMGTVGTWRPGGSGSNSPWNGIFDRLVSQSTLRFHFDGLGAGQLYTVVLYQGYAVQNSPSYSVNGVVRTATYATASSSMLEGRDYLRYENIAADANGRITIGAAGGWDSNSGLTAIQIEGAFVPAPGALALLGLAGCVGSRRRR